MPIIAYICFDKHVTKKFHRQAAKAPAFIVCDNCKKESKKMLSAPSTSSKITVDNGFQSRAVEIDPNIIELNEEKSNKNYKGD